MPSEFTGLNTPVPQAERRTFSRENGWTTTRTWEGPTNEIMALAAGLTSEASTIDISGEGPTRRLTATYADAQDEALDSQQQELNVTWELLGNSLFKDLKTHSSIEPDNEEERKQVLKAEENIHQPGKHSEESLGVKGLKLYQHLSKGTEGYEVVYWVLRKTIKVGVGTDVALSISNVNRVEAPTGVDTALFSIPVSIEDIANMRWLKRPPSVLALGRGKYSIVQEWWAGKWSSDLYGGAEIP